jgi:hypothetical protein
VKYVRGSQGRKQKFLEVVKQVSLDSHKRLKQDVPTDGILPILCLRVLFTIRVLLVIWR